MADTLTPDLDRMATKHLPTRPTGGLRRHLASLRAMLDNWEERRRFRIRLQDMLISSPYLIDDIGLTRKQAEAEITKPFWRD
jgi:uncharacterized protein YjiS (DUF1127 family)